MMGLNNGNVVLILEAMQRLVAFHHSRGFDMTKLRVTLHNVTNACLQKSTSAFRYPSTDSEKTCSRKDILGGLAIVFTRNAENPIRKASHFCESISGSDANQLNLCFIYKDMTTRLFTRHNFSKNSNGSSANNKKQEALKNGHVLFSTSQTQTNIWELIHDRTQEKIDCFSADGSSWALQQRLWSHGMFLSELFRSRRTTFAHKRWF